MKLFAWVICIIACVTAAGASQEAAAAAINPPFEKKDVCQNMWKLMFK